MSRLRTLFATTPWVALALVYVTAPGYLPFATQIMIMILFALSLDLCIGYGGILTLGHAGFYGVGAYASGLLAVRAGWTEPLTNAVCAASIAAIVGGLSGAVVLKGRGFSISMLTLTVNVLLFECVNKGGQWTGGDDGLSGIDMLPVFGRFPFDIFGTTAFWYVFGALAIVFLTLRMVVRSSYGQSLVGIRENAARMRAIGCPVYARLLVAYTISSTVAGLAGALQAQTTQIVGMQSLGFDLSANIVVMLILGGAGRLYGAFVGVPIYLIAQDVLAKGDPANWYFWLGIVLLAILVFARGGVLGLVDAMYLRFKAAA
jgi:branched-chain amino acid transport system permease protein